MDNSLEKRVNLTSLLKHTLPTVIMMIFFSFYTIVDGMFIAKFVGSNALSATSIVFPIINVILGIGIMFATGGSAIVAKKIGEKKVEEARKNFTLITISALVLGLIIEILSIIFIKDIIYLLGSTETLFNYCKDYLFYMVIFTPFIILKMFFDYFLVTAGVPKLALISSVAGGIVNMVLDYVFIVLLHLGIKGAALATCIGYMLPSFIGIVYFMNKNHLIHFVKTKFEWKIIINSAANGSSELVTQLSSAVTTFLFNIVMIKMLGEDGVAAITIILYMQILLNSAYQGFTSGVQPRISYNYGRKDKEQLSRLIKYSLIIISAFGVITFILSRMGSEILISIFATKGTNLFDISLHGFMLFSFGFLVGGINIFTSGMFTAYSNGKVSALISLLRTFIFFGIGMLILPNILAVNGVWLVVPFAEISTLLISIYFIFKYKKEYMYGDFFKNKEITV